jgi:hypothetical protein
MGARGSSRLVWGGARVGGGPQLDRGGAQAGGGSLGRCTGGRWLGHGAHAEGGSSEMPDSVGGWTIRFR